ncbi:ribose-5-phosphate isomerase RpiA [Flavisphingomonas formosensis]|uniref:ribose-5-phosphate isomerase RpiA n=1 Tax=Flavisphingomonas formosensis TaxID=861534 RepID=UPI0012F9B15F|nr:ribose-5-phosphate isomerase RpiA [Sphingomonas formosensis]
MAAQPDAIDRRKRAAAEAAAAEIGDGMTVGLGTGSTAAFAIAAIARRMRDGLSVRAVATSERTAAAALSMGIPLVAMDDVDSLDLAIDGVDEIDPLFRAIKGAGGAMLREKIVASAASRMIAIADASKFVDRLGARPVPIEVLPLARAFVARRVTLLGGTAHLRAGTDGPARSDQGNVILDCAFGPVSDPAALAVALSAIPGALGHGLFVEEIDALYLGDGDGVIRRDRPPPTADG